MPRDHLDPTDRLPVEDDLDPAIAAVLWRAYSEDVDIDTAARHLWRIHRAASEPVRTSGRGMRRALVGALTGLMILMSAGGALAASGSSLPGDALYSVKRGAERTRLLLALSPDSDARLHLAMARQRLEEADVAAHRRPQVLPRLIEDATVAIENAERTGSADVAAEALVVREEASQKAVELAVVLDDPEDKAFLVAASQRLMPLPVLALDDVEAITREAADALISAAAPNPAPVEPVEPVEPPAETASSTPGTTPAPVPAQRPTTPVAPAPAPEPEPEPSDDEPGEAELPPADPKDSPGVGKETQELKSDEPEPAPEPTAEPEPAQEGTEAG